VEDDQKRLDKAIEKVREWAKREPNCEIRLHVIVEQGRITHVSKEMRTPGGGVGSVEAEMEDEE